jgi:hypothetical protein
LCEYLWKQQQQEQGNEDGEPDPPGSGAAGGGGGGGGGTYDEYRRAYCLRFVQAFFNKHLDDSWLRNRYSPLCRRRQIEQENARAAAEAAAFARGLLEDGGGGGGGPDFVARAELWGTLDSKNRVPESHQPSAFPCALLVSDIPPRVVDGQLEAALLQLAEGDLPDGGPPGDSSASPWLRVYSADPVVAGAAEDPRTFLRREAVVVCRTPSVRRTVLANLEARQLQAGPASSSPPPPSLIPRKEADATASGGRHGGGGSSAPGAQAAASGAVAYALEVDCTDPYGRAEVDVRSRAGEAHGPEDHAPVPPAGATVRVRPLPPPRTHVLAASLSSPSRIPADKDAAVVMARALDAARKIEKHKLDDLLEQKQKQLSDALTPLTDAQVLDVTVAYLRRVHLFCFYTCASSASLGQFLAHPKQSTVYLRLRQPQPQPHQQAPGEASAGDGAAPQAASDDLLVKLRDEQIASVLEACPKWISGEDAAAGGADAASAEEGGAGSGELAGSAAASGVEVGVVSEAMREEADRIEAAEEAAVEAWLNDHAILDDDKRARCSFHFCHKLFKDTVFLRKHLLKKHGEFLRAEQAKCHDGAMMEAWESSATRPVCDVLVDCGANFGLKPARLLPQAVPDCVDPEPALWQREEEKRKAAEEQRQRREEMRQQQQSQYRETAGAGPTASRGFVDVDDMKEEKIELSFDNIPDPTASGKKKKKKRKLL